MGAIRRRAGRVTLPGGRLGGRGATALPGGDSAARSASAPYQNAPLAACLDARAKMTTEFFIEIAKLKPGIAFFRDDAFVDDSARTNLQQVFNQFSPTTSIKVI